jgi:hypothetical protein
MATYQQHQTAYTQTHANTQQSLGAVNVNVAPDVANLVTSTGLSAAPQQTAPQSRTFNNRFLAPKKEAMQQQLNSAVPPPPPPDDDEDF